MNSYEAEFYQKLIREKNKSLAVIFDSTFGYIDDVLSIKNCFFHTYVDSRYPSELEIKDTTDVSYLDNFSIFPLILYLMPRTVKMGDWDALSKFESQVSKLQARYRALNYLNCKQKSSIVFVNICIGKRFSKQSLSIVIVYIGIRIHFNQMVLPFSDYIIYEHIASIYLVCKINQNAQLTISGNFRDIFHIAKYWICRNYNPYHFL